MNILLSNLIMDAIITKLRLNRLHLSLACHLPPSDLLPLSAVLANILTLLPFPGSSHGLSSHQFPFPSPS